MAHPVYKLSNDVVVPSVTTVISNNLGWNKSILIAWNRKLTRMGKNPDDEVRIAADIGHIAHALVEARVKKQSIDLSQYPKEKLIIARNAYKSFCSWEQYWKPDEYVCSERSLVSEKYKFGGTIDLVVKKDGLFYIQDCKTTNFTHSEMVIQLAAYKNMYQELFNVDISGCGIIKISKDEDLFEHYVPTSQQLELGWEVFKSLLLINNAKYELEFDEGNKVANN